MIVMEDNEVGGYIKNNTGLVPLKEKTVIKW